MVKLEHRTILITGGTSGIGFELARQMVSRGNTVIVTGRDPEKLDVARAALPGLTVIQSDVTDPEAIDRLHAEVTRRFPSLDTLVNNAGVMRNLDLTRERDIGGVTSEIAVLLEGPIRMVQRFLPHLASRPSPLIVNVSSGLAFVPFPIAPIYSAAKAGLHAYTLCLRAQLAGTPIGVVELAPPGTETPLFRREFETEMAGVKAMDVATLVARAVAGIEKGKLEIRPGLSNVLKIASRVAPGFMLAQLAKAGRGDRGIARSS